MTQATSGLSHYEQWRRVLQNMTPELRDELITKIGEGPEDEPLPLPSELGIEIPRSYGVQRDIPEPRSWSDVFTAEGAKETLKNAPASLGREFKRFGELAKEAVAPAWRVPQGQPVKEAIAQHPVSLMAKLGKGVVDLGDAAFNVEGVPDIPGFVDKERGKTSEAQLATAVGKEFVAQTTDAERFISDPAATLLNAADAVALLTYPPAAALHGAPTASRILGKVSRAANAVGDLPLSTARLGAKGATAAGRGLTKAFDRGADVAAPVTGVTTGLGKEIMAQPYKAGRTGQGAKFAAEQRSSRTMLDAAGDIEEAERAASRPLGEDVGRMRHYLREQSQAIPVDVANARRKILGDIEQDGAGGLLREKWNIHVHRKPNGSVDFDFPESIAETSKPQFRKALNRVAQMSDEVPATEVDQILKTWNDMKLTDDVSGSIVRDMHRALSEDIAGVTDASGRSYSDVMGAYSRHQQWRERGIEEPLNARIAAQGLKHVNKTQLANALNSAFKQSREIPIKAIQELEGTYPTRLGAESPTGSIGMRTAAQATKRWDPTGLAGHMQLVAAVLGSGYAGFLEPSTVLFTLPATALLYSPRVAAEALKKIGAWNTGMENAFNLTRDFIESAERSGFPITATTTTGEVLQRLGVMDMDKGFQRENADKQPSPIGKQIQSGQTATVESPGNVQSRLLPLIGQSR